jgi:hypothetical protein
VLYSIEREILLDSQTPGVDFIHAVDGLVRYTCEAFRGSIETMLVDINKEYQEAQNLDCNELVLSDIEKLNADVLDYTVDR